MQDVVIYLFSKISNYDRITLHPPTTSIMPTIRKIEQQLKAVANARRLAILQYLKKHRNATAGELAEAVRVSMPPASQHLRILKSAGIIEYKKRGRFMTYRLALHQEEPIKTLLALL